MYKEYFGLKENPFNINTDPRYLYLTPHIEEALNGLSYGIETRKGFILLTGEVGTGKTTLLNKLLESLHQQSVATAFVFNARLSESQFLDYVMADFGIECKSRMKSRMLFKLHQWLLDRYQAGQPTVLVVDEAQNLSRQTLEEIRLLTNMETSTEKLLQIVLAGQPELEVKLNQRELRQLRQRIALRAHTLPLTAEQTGGYILERLRIAGGNEEIFSAPAIEAIYRHARGIPRITNLLSEHALLRAFLEQRKPIPAEVVEDVSREFSLDEVEFLAQPEAPSRSNGRRGPRRAENSRSRMSKSTVACGAAEPNGLPASGVAQSERLLFVYGYGPEGPFYEQARTIATNARGGLISLQSLVQSGQRLLITNKETECSQECVVQFLGARLARGVDVAFEFTAPAPQFWDMAEMAKNPAEESELEPEPEKDAARESEQACA
jgi:general secretion pathway protein A